jgi:hypothetical protein
MTPSKTLLSKKVLYLADHHRGDVVKAGFRTVLAFIKGTKCAPGSTDVLIITPVSKSKRFRDAYKTLSLKDRVLFNLVILPSHLARNIGVAEIVWIDDNHMVRSIVKDTLLKRGNNCHVILSGRKPVSEKMQIVVDTREQKPLWKGKECKRMTMDCGDYTTEKLFNTFHIERKSLEDLYGTILGGHIRFRKEHIRAQSNNIGLSLYIEGTKKDFGAKRFKGGHKRQCAGATLVKIIDSIESRWPLEVVWCGSRLKAKKMIYARLQKEERRVA